MDVVQKHDRSTATEPLKPRRTRTKKDVDNDHPELRSKRPETKKLRMRLQEFAEQNESLAKAMHDKNHEISELKRSVHSLNEVLNSVPIDELRCNSSIASTKIIELSKKNRQLRAELETTKMRASKKDTIIHKLERNLKAAEEKVNAKDDLGRKASALSMEEMHSKVSGLQQKLFESRNKTVELQTQLKLAQKCLQAELGESFTNLNILASQSANSNWRGRAQQILHLQQKIHELKERLEMHEHHPSGRVSSFTHHVESVSAGAGDGTSIGGAGAVGVEGGVALQLMMNGNGVGVGAVGGSTFDRFSPGVRKNEILHRAKVESLEKEIAALKTQLEEQRSKVLALKVRNKTLNDEIVKYKVKACSLEEQTDYNGMNLATMNEKMSMQKYQFERRIEDICRDLAEAQRRRDEAVLRGVEVQTKLDNMTNLLENKEEFIVELNDMIQKLETDLKAVCGGFLFSCRELKKEEFIAILDTLESEKNALVEVTKTLNERVNQERTKNDHLNEQLSKQKIRISRLEMKIRELERDLEAQTERKKRSQRIAEYANSISTTSLNTSVGSFVFENSALPNSSNFIDEQTQMQLSDLRNQLEVAHEKIMLLQEKIVYLADEKDNDIHTFEEIMLNSKRIILDTILTEKPNPSFMDIATDDRA